MAEEFYREEAEGDRDPGDEQPQPIDLIYTGPTMEELEAMGPVILPRAPRVEREEAAENMAAEAIRQIYLKAIQEAENRRLLYERSVFIVRCLEGEFDGGTRTVRGLFVGNRLLRTINGSGEFTPLVPTSSLRFDS